MDSLYNLWWPLDLRSDQHAGVPTNAEVQLVNTYKQITVFANDRPQQAKYQDTPFTALSLSIHSDYPYMFFFFPFLDLMPHAHLKKRNDKVVYSTSCSKASGEDINTLLRCVNQ